MDYTRHLIKHSIIYGSGESLIRLANFLLIPIYTRYLVPDEYGAFQLLLITTNLVAIVFELGIGSAIFKSILYDENVDGPSTYSTAFYSIMLISWLGLLPLLLFRERITLLLTGSYQYVLAFSLFMISVSFRNVAIIPLAKLRIQDRSTRYVIIALIKFIVEVSFVVYFIVVSKTGVLGISWAYFLSSFILMFVFIQVIFRDLRIAFSIKVLKDMLEYGLPLVPGALSIFVMNMSNRYFLKQYSSVEQVALFSLGYYIGMIMNVIVYAFQRVWASAMFKVAKEKDHAVIFGRNFTYFLLILSTCTLLLSIFSREIIEFMTTREYYESYKVVPYICTSFIFYGIYYYLSYGMNIRKMTRYQPMIIGASACLNLLLNFILIPRYSMVGAALASTISFALMGILAGVVSNRFYPVSIEKKRVIYIGLIFMITMILGFYMEHGSGLQGIALRFVLLIAAGCLLLKLKFFSEEERKKMRQLLHLNEGR